MGSADFGTVCPTSFNFAVGTTYTRIDFNNAASGAFDCSQIKIHVVATIDLESPKFIKVGCFTKVESGTYKMACAEGEYATIQEVVATTHRYIHIQH